MHYREHTPLNGDHLIGAFYLLAAGLLVATFSLFVEIIGHKYGKSVKLFSC